MYADRIDALHIAEGADTADSVWAFIAELNKIIDRTENIVTIRRSKAVAKKRKRKPKKKNRPLAPPLPLSGHNDI